MGKRFVDTEIFKKDWFGNLSPTLKLAFLTLILQCDPVGVWDGNKRYIEFLVGDKIDWSGLLQVANGNIEVLPNGKWWLIDFCVYQYGELRDTCPPHRYYLQLLAKHGLSERVPLGYPKGSLRAKEKEKEKESITRVPRKAKIEVIKPNQIEWNYETMKWENITDELVDMWAHAYPDVDIETELGAAGSWLTANRDQKRSRYAHFLTNWLKRQQDGERKKRTGDTTY